MQNWNGNGTICRGLGIMGLLVQWFDQLKQSVHKHLMPTLAGWERLLSIRSEKVRIAGISWIGNETKQSSSSFQNDWCHSQRAGSLLIQTMRHTSTGSLVMIERDYFCMGLYIVRFVLEKSCMVYLWKSKGPSKLPSDKIKLWQELEN